MRPVFMQVNFTTRPVHTAQWFMIMHGVLTVILKLQTFYNPCECPSGTLSHSDIVPKSNNLYVLTLTKCTKLPVFY